jgi:predicted DNA-binding transcriptional regulator YafY
MEANYAHLSVLQAAIAARHILLIRYSTKAGVASEREIEPVGLQYYAMAWHLMAWCHLRGEYRDFRVSRIDFVHDTALPFRIEKHRSLAELTAELPVSF